MPLTSLWSEVGAELQVDLVISEYSSSPPFFLETGSYHSSGWFGIFYVVQAGLDNGSQSSCLTLLSGKTAEHPLWVFS